MSSIRIKNIKYSHFLILYGENAMAVIPLGYKDKGATAWQNQQMASANFQLFE